MELLVACDFAFDVFDLGGESCTFFSNIMMKASNRPMSASMASSLSKFTSIIQSTTNNGYPNRIFYG